MDEQKYLIWSWEHNAWWRANGNGYASDRAKAGVYSHAEALDICLGANIGFYHGNTKMPNEGMVPLRIIKD